MTWLNDSCVEQLSQLICTNKMKFIAVYKSVKKTSAKPKDIKNRHN